MDILIDNNNLKTNYGITVLDYTGALGFASERTNERVWEDKSGVDKNLENVKYDAKEFILNCIVKAPNEIEAYNQVKILVEYMKNVGVFVLSFRDASRNIRLAFLCERSDTVIADINIRSLNSLYYFKLGFKDVNPNAIVFYEEIVGNAVTINYPKGQTAALYWGDGSQETVSNSGNYSKSDYASNGPVDIFIDLDKDAEVVNPLNAAFSVDIISGVKELSVNFTDESTGTPEIWSWDFGDGNTSSQQSPSHVYTQSGIFTVTLQVFNSAGGFDTETKTNYITVRNARGIINDAGEFGLINTTNYGLKN